MNRHNTEGATMTQPTAGPWEVRRFSSDHKFRHIRQVGDYLPHIECTGTQCQQDAAHIVHCVNTYPALLAALKSIRDCTILDAETPELRAQNQNVHIMAITAIAQAEGKD